METNECEGCIERTDYILYKRCRNCNRQTEGIQDFKNLKTGKITKTCIKCRNSVIKSLQKRASEGKTKKKITMREKMEVLNNIIKKNYNDDFYLTDEEKKIIGELS